MRYPPDKGYAQTGVVTKYIPGTGDCKPMWEVEFQYEKPTRMDEEDVFVGIQDFEAYEDQDTNDDHRDGNNEENNSDTNNNGENYTSVNFLTNF